MARPESEGGWYDDGATGANRGKPVSGAVRAGGDGAIPRGSAPADIRSLEGRRRPGGAGPSARRVGGGGPLRYLLDSVILIDHFNGRPEATDCLAWMAAESALSVITRAEVMAGFEE